MGRIKDSSYKGTLEMLLRAKRELSKEEYSTLFKSYKWYVRVRLSLQYLLCIVAIGVLVVINVNGYSLLVPLALFCVFFALVMFVFVSIFLSLNSWAKFLKIQ